jgi:bacterioferritin
MTKLLNDVERFHSCARVAMIDTSAATASGTNSNTVAYVLNQTLSMKLVCVLRYSSQCFVGGRNSSDCATAKWIGRAAENADHADRIATHIVRLGGVAHYNPESLTGRCYSECTSSFNWATLNQEYFAAQCLAIELYDEVISWLGDSEPTTRLMLQEIRADEERSAEDLLDYVDHSR